MNAKENDIIITIVMALYNPRLDWFKELLNSLVQQDFKSVEWLIIDDASEKVSLDELTCIIDGYANSDSRKIPYKIIKNDKNVGSNETYRKLIRLAGGKFIAFCDQDDVWEKNKLSCLYEEIKKNDGALIYADMSVINSSGKKVKESFQYSNSFFCHVSGADATGAFLIRNYAPGCSVLVRREILSKYNTIPYGSYWDHWLNIVASVNGNVIYIPKKLMRYRIHGSNQTGRFFDINTKEDYYKNRLKPLYTRMHELKKANLHFNNENEVYSFIEARYHKNILEIWRYRRVNKIIAIFEIMLLFTPEIIVNLLIKAVKRYKN